MPGPVVGVERRSSRSRPARGLRGARPGPWSLPPPPVGGSRSPPPPAGRGERLSRGAAAPSRLARRPWASWSCFPAGNLGPGDRGGMERGPRAASLPGVRLRCSLSAPLPSVRPPSRAASTRLLWRIQCLDPHAVEPGDEGAAAGSAGRTRPGWPLSLWCSLKMLVKAPAALVLPQEEFGSLVSAFASVPSPLSLPSSDRCSDWRFSAPSPSLALPGTRLPSTTVGRFPRSGAGGGGGRAGKTPAQPWTLSVTSSPHLSSS